MGERTMKHVGREGVRRGVVMIAHTKNRDVRGGGKGWG